MISLNLVKKMKKWVGFVGIVTLVGIVFEVVLSVIAFSISIKTTGALYFGLSLVLMAVFMALPLYMSIKLLKAKKALNEIVILEPEDQSIALTVALDNLTSYFKTIGILVIIALVFAVVFFVFAMIMGMTLLNGYY